MKRRDIVGGLFLAGLGVFIIQQSRLMTYGDEFGPGPGLLPYWLGVLLTVLAASMVVHALWKKEGRGLKPATTSAPATFRVVLASAGLIGTVAVLEVFGFFVSFALLSFLLVYAIERRSFPTAITVTIAITLGFVVLFRLILPVPLPLNPWGF